MNQPRNRAELGSDVRPDLRQQDPYIDDTVDVVHGHQQLSLFNAHDDGCCFLPTRVGAHSETILVCLTALSRLQNPASNYLSTVLDRFSRSI